MSTSKAILKTWAFRSSNGVTMYQTLLLEGNTTSCDCPGWTRRVAPNGSRSCKHTRMVELGIASSTAESFVDYAGRGASITLHPVKAKQPKQKKPVAEEGPVLVRDINLED